MFSFTFHVRLPPLLLFPSPPLVLRRSPEGLIFIILCKIESCVHSSCSGKLGLFWVCFFIALSRIFLRNPLSQLSLCSFWAFWKLGLFGFELALNWVCFHQVSNWIFSDNPLIVIRLRSFGCLKNWLCFA